MVTQTQTQNRATRRANASNSNRSEATDDAPAQPSPKHDSTSPARKGMDGAALLKAARPTNRLLAKQELMTTVSQQLAEIADIQAGDAEQNERAEELASNVGLRLFSGQTTGILTAEEVTEILGNQFGWRKKGDAKQIARNVSEQSKTPYGYGETIRKRITRAVKAHAFANGAEPDNFFKPFEREDVADNMERVESGDLSVFSLYDILQDDRRELTANDDGPINAAFDPGKVLKTVQKLTEAGAVEAFANNPSLVIVYASMVEAVEAITDALMSRDDADQIIAAVQAAPTAEPVAAE